MKQRKIKFRCWDGEKMIYEDQNGWFTGVKISTHSAHQTIRFHAAKRETHVMQFTGLLDKNGKEIYEGDRVFVDSVDCGRSFYSGIELEISWCEGWSCWGAEYAGELIFMNQMWQPAVVGNIYEKVA